MAKKNKKRKKHRKFWLIVKIQVVLLLFVIAGLSYYFLGGYAKQVGELHKEAMEIVSTSSEATFKSNQNSEVYDAEGNLISTLTGDKDVTYVEYDDIPGYFVTAMVSTEDRRFYKHNGVDIKAIFRAAVDIVKTHSISQGGSTITQQLARTVFLTTEKSWQRKVEEAFISLELEKIYSKDKIMEFYLNNIYFGNGYYGIQAASQGYFSCDVDELSLSQIAFLCAIPNNPTYYDPVDNYDNTITRRNLFLKNMYENGNISEVNYEKAKSEEIVLNQPEEQKVNNYVETYVYHCAAEALMEQEGFVFKNEFETEAEETEYEEEYDALYTKCKQSLYTSGYRIYTAIDMEKQQELQDSLDDGLSDFTETSDSGAYALQGSATCIDNETGYVVAIVGGRSQEDISGYTLNRAYQSFRQPGSSIKPLVVYTPALEAGYTPDSVVNDKKTEDGPSNSDSSYSGKISLRTAVAKSKNTVAWALFEELTPKVGLSYLLNMHFSKIVSSDYIPAASLGGLTNGVSSVEMASGFATIENDGVYRNPTCITKITTAEGEEILTTEQEGETIYKQNAARMMTDVLTTVMDSGTGASLKLSGMPCAGKTGTTTSNKDGWFVGYTRYYTTAVWVGYDTPKALTGLSGATYPGKIWYNFMSELHKDLESLDFLPYVSYSDTSSTSLEEEEEDEDSEEDTEEEEDEKKDKKNKENTDEEAEDEEKENTSTDAPANGNENGNTTDSSNNSTTTQTPSDSGASSNTTTDTQTSTDTTDTTNQGGTTPTP